jgi:hypothetical protein
MERNFMDFSAKVSNLEARPLTVGLVLCCASIVVVANPIVLGFLFDASPLRLAIYVVFDIVLFLYGVYLPLLGVKTGRIWLQIVSLLVVGAMPIFAVATEVFFGYRNAEKAKLTFQSIAAERETLFRLHPQLGWWHSPNSTIVETTSSSSYTAVYEIDNKGRKIVVQSPERTKIHFFGDSFIFGYGVSNADTALQKLANKFSDSARINFLNYGVTGHGLEQMLTRFHSSVAEMDKGDIVVFAIISDDVRRNLIECSYISDHALNYSVGVQYLPVLRNNKLEIRNIWEECSYVLSLFRFSEKPLGSKFKRLYETYQQFRNGDQLKQNAIDIINNARTLASDRGLTFILMVFPTFAECLTHSSKLDTWDFGVKPLLLSQLCPDSPEEVSSLYYLDSPWLGHWNVEGNKWAAQSIAIVLARRGLL